MKILLADDNAGRTLRFRAAMERKFSKESVELISVLTAKDSLAELQRTAFDLFIIDVLLPWMAGDPPSEKSSREVVRAIAEGRVRFLPTSVVGVTAHSDCYASSASEFADYLWTLIETAEDSDEWIERLLRCVDFLRKLKSASRAGVETCDILVVTALRNPEMSAVHALPWNWETELPLDRRTFVRRGTIGSGESTLSVASVVAPRMGMATTAALSAKVLAMLRPKIIIMPGICAGYPDHTRLGDVVVASPSWDYQSGKRVIEADGATLQIAPNHVDVDEELIALWEQLRIDGKLLSDVRDAFPSPPPHELTCHVGPMATGSAVVSDVNFRDEITDQMRKVLAIDMEVYGMYCAARSASDVSLRYFAAKSVCDYADPMKKDTSREYAAYTSARLIHEFCVRFGERICLGAQSTVSVGAS